MSDILDQVRSFITERNPDVGSLGLDDDLIDSRAIDSLAFVDFVFLLEELGGRPIDPEGLDVDDFRTLRTIRARFLDTAVST
ncbi:acyl carrier protein [Streptomyces sp. NPDC090499]|uniref:acyl carrier protein n=1 Tax=Streptomyces sp. NPDC090499 TaxID=3365965 RepID=UPI0037F2703F